MIVHPGQTLLPELYGTGSEERKDKAFPKLIAYGTKHAQKLGVELMLETRVAGATPNEVHLSNGERIPTRTIISAVGTRPSPAADRRCPLEFDPRGPHRRRRVHARRRPRRALGRAATAPRCLTRAAARARRRHAVGSHGGTPPRASTLAAFAGQEPKPPKPFRSTGSAGHLDRPAHRRRRGAGDPARREARLARLPRSWRLIVIPSWDRGCGARGLDDLAVRRPRHRRRWTQGGAANFESASQRLPAARCSPSGRRPVRHVHVIVEGRRGRREGRRRTRETVRGEAGPATTSVGSGSSCSTAMPRRARLDGQARSRSAPTRRTCCRTRAARRADRRRHRAAHRARPCGGRAASERGSREPVANVVGSTGRAQTEEGASVETRISPETKTSPAGRADGTGVPVWNWTREHVSYPREVVDIGSVDEVPPILADAERYPTPVRGLASRHSTTRCGEADGGTIVDVTAPEPDPPHRLRLRHRRARRALHRRDEGAREARPPVLRQHRAREPLDGRLRRRARRRTRRCPASTGRSTPTRRGSRY